VNGQPTIRNAQASEKHDNNADIVIEKNIFDEKQEASDDNADEDEVVVLTIPHDDDCWQQAFRNQPAEDEDTEGIMTKP
jgi:hypothetical protein